MKQLETLHRRYEISLEAIVKTDLLRQGVWFTPEALRYAAAFKEKSYFIFSFDRVAQKDLQEEERHAAPEEMALIGGPHDFKRTIVSTRLNPQSPYQVRIPPPPSPSRGEGLREGVVSLFLFYNDEKICDVTLLERPAYYEKKLVNGKPVSDITPTIEWGYLIYITVFRLCQYWGTEEECAFCDINENYRQQKKERSYTTIKGINETIEALQIINTIDTEKISQAYTVTGGSITSELQNKNEVTFYAQYAEAIEHAFPQRWIGKAVVQALPPDEVKILKRAGYQIYHPNFEVWDKNLFEKICPGKTKYVGRDEWIKRVVDAAEIFGPSHVIPNFVAGVEMSKPHGFTDIKEAVHSTAEGLDFFMSKGIVPRFTVWCVEPNTVLSETNTEPPSLEYYTYLLQVYRDTFQKYKLPTPPGYGPSGLGKAVFSVSAFMDVLG